MRKILKVNNVLWTDQRGITGLETAIVLIAFVVVSSVFAFAALSTGLFSSDKAKETINAGLTEASGTLEVRGSIIGKRLPAVVDEAAATYTADGNITVLPALKNIPVVSKSDTVTLKTASTNLTRVDSNPAPGEYTINNTTGVITLATALTAGDSIEVDYSAMILDEISLQVANAAGGVPVDLTPGNTLITYVDVNQAVNLASGDFTSTALGNSDSDGLVEIGETHEIKISDLANKLNPDLKNDTTFILTIKPPQGAVIYIARTTPINLEAYNDLG